jgi:hypothetical protein
MALTFTQDDLDALKEALLTGASRVKVGDREIEYRSQADIRAAIAMVQAYLDGVSTATYSPNVVQSTYSKKRS